MTPPPDDDGTPAEPVDPPPAARIEPAVPVEPPARTELAAQAESLPRVEPVAFVEPSLGSPESVAPVEPSPVGAAAVAEGQVGAVGPSRFSAPESPLPAGGWGELGETELVALAWRCWEADGGMPLAVDPGFLQGRWFRPGTVTFAVRATDSSGSGESRLLAAVAVRPGPDGPVITGLVDPAVRGRGLGARLLDAALAVTGAAGEHVSSPSVPALPGSWAGKPVTVETEGFTPAAEKLFESRGLRQFFAEDVMRIDLTAGAVPEPDWAEGARVTEWTEATAERFHAVYAAAFRERPGFPDPPAAEWIKDNAEDDEFRADWSLLVSLPEAGDVAFVTAAEGWIVQVGVLPAARRAGLAAALIRESLRRMAAAGFGEAWLCVNVDNPAASLYRRLGFRDRGRRARYRFPAAPAAPAAEQLDGSSAVVPLDGSSAVVVPDGRSAEVPEPERR